MRFFHKLRKSILSSGPLNKYIIYAVGEIVLVVLGILIALAINGSYENHKKSLETKRTAKLVLTQLEKDQFEISAILKEWDGMELIIDTILLYTPQDSPIPSSCSECFTVLNAVSLPSTSERVPNLISRNTLYEGVLESKLNEIETTYKEALKGSQMYENEIFDQLTENFNYWKLNFKWFSKYLNEGDCSTAECIQYFRSDSDYRNRVAYFKFITLDAYYGSLYDFMQTLEKFQKDLESLLLAN